MDDCCRLVLPYNAVAASNRRNRSLMTLPGWGRKVLLLAIIPVPLNLYEKDGKKHFFGTWILERGSNPRSPTFQAGSFNHCTRVPVPQGPGSHVSVGAAATYRLLLSLNCSITKLGLLQIHCKDYLKLES